jgi:uncharacterized protein YwgA
MLARLEEATGRRFDPRSFAGRLRIQKAIYLLRSMGHPVARHYSYNMYLRGPYSPQLTQDYYRLMETDVRPSDVEIDPDMLSVVNDAVGMGDSFLEAVATVHSIYKTNAPMGNREDILRMARSIKPQLHHHYDNAWDFLVRTGLI